MKTRTAEALEDAARRLRMADVSAQGEQVKQILQDVEDRVNQFKADVGAGYHSREADCLKRAEPVEHIIVDHPIASAKCKNCIFVGDPPYPTAEFPSMLLPGTMIIGFLGAVLLIQRTKEH